MNEFDLFAAEFQAMGLENEFTIEELLEALYAATDYDTTFYFTTMATVTELVWAVACAYQYPSRYGVVNKERLTHILTRLPLDLARSLAKLTK